MSSTKKSRYTPAPPIPTDEELRRRYDQVIAVINGQQTVARAARVLGMPRNHFQTLLHRAKAGLIEGLTPKPAGRPAKPPREAALEAEVAKLKAQVATLEERGAMIDRLLTVAGGVASGRTPLTGRRKKPTTDDPDDSPAAALQEIRAMRDQGLSADDCAKAIGVSPATLSRRLAGTTSLRCPTARLEPPPEAVTAARDLVRQTHGLAGADALAHATGLSRRQAARVKQDERCRMEHERKAAARRVWVNAPNVIRGFDAMHLTRAPGRPYALVAADAAIPFRTTIRRVTDYDGCAVAATLAADFETHGAPLVCRLDRASCHRTAEVLSVLDAFGVLVLHGPPHYPRYYGQLERQNREHRDWLADLDLDLADAELDALLGAMKSALNGAWPRRSLAWCTAEQRWRERPPLAVDRAELRDDVGSRAARLLSRGVCSARDPDLHQRLAIEHALAARGLLAVQQGVTLLGD